MFLEYRTYTVEKEQKEDKGSTLMWRDVKTSSHVEVWREKQHEDYAHPVAIFIAFFDDAACVQCAQLHLFSEAEN